jgi:hypothetical protein
LRGSPSRNRKANPIVGKNRSLNISQSWVVETPKSVGSNNEVPDQFRKHAS